MRFFRTFPLAASGLLIAIGCGGTPAGDVDAAIVFDATFPDGGTDSGPPPSIIGTRCAADEDCGGGTDIYCDGALDGYCTAVCESDEDCPSGSACVQISRTTSVCLASCEPGASADECPPGTGCTSGGPGSPPVCLPGCESDADCATDLECLEGSGGYGAGVCVDPDEPLGGTCTSDGDCPPGGTCATEADYDYPGGTCILYGCDPMGNSGCPSDGECLPAGMGGGICWDGCATDADCRADYECITSTDYPDRPYCEPRFVASNLGGNCETGSCAGGYCMYEGWTGFPGSYCADEGCDPAAAVTGCPDNGVCVATSDGGGLCLLGCTLDVPCARTMYDCRPVGGEGSPLACMPACTIDAHCTATTRSGTRYVCNPGTGRCALPFTWTELGEPCTAEDYAVCRGGLCLDEAGDGWPAGTCTYPGCRLSGEGPAATCQTGSVCTDDGGGDPAIGVCVDACTVGVTSCRPGYACVALVEGETAGACRPACGAGTCGTGRTCNAETGLCR